jgi:hypothetical protein
VTVPLALEDACVAGLPFGEPLHRDRTASSSGACSAARTDGCRRRGWNGSLHHPESLVEGPCEAEVPGTSTPSGTVRRSSPALAPPGRTPTAPTSPGARARSASGSSPQASSHPRSRMAPSPALAFRYGR